MDAFDTLTGYQNNGQGVLFRDFSGETTTATSTDVIANSIIPVKINKPSVVKITISGRAQNNTDTNRYTLQIAKDGVSVKSTGDNPKIDGIGQVFSLVHAEKISNVGTYEFSMASYGIGGDTIGVYNASIIVEITPL